MAFLALAAVTALAAVADERTHSGAAAGAAGAERLAASAPLSFVPNAGQLDRRVRYHAQTPGFAVYATQRKLVLDLAGKERGVVLDLRFVGANPHASVVGERRATGRVNYLSGHESRTNLPTFAQLRYRDLWPGIDMVLRGQGGTLKYEFLVRPGADPSAIRLAYRGADGISMSDSGALRVRTPLGPLTDAAPRSYQWIGGAQRPVPSRYSVARAGYGFALGSHDRSRPLVIDPGLDYSTFIGGAGDDRATDVAVDAQGAAYVTGPVLSSDFPTTPGAYDATDDDCGNPNCDYDVVVSKLDPSGSALVYSTYLQSPNWDWSNAIAVDAGGHAYVTGYTQGTGFPVTPGAFDTTFSSDPSTTNAPFDVFVTKLSADGSALDYSTYLGGSTYSFSAGSERGSGIAVNAQGHAYVAGETNTVDFPTTPGAFQTTLAGFEDAFVTKLSADGSSIDYSTFVGGPGVDRALGLALDGAGAAYIAGAAKIGFPTTPGAYDTAYTGTCNPGCPDNPFVTKLAADGSALAYSTYFGDRGYIEDIALDADGDAYTAGWGPASTPGALGSTSGNGAVAKLDASGSTLVYSTGLRASRYWPYALAVDARENAFVTGYVLSTDLPTTFDAYQRTCPEDFPPVCVDTDAFLLELNGTGTGVLYGTYLGGTAPETTSTGEGVALGDGAAYVAGSTTAFDFPTTAGAYDRTLDCTSAGTCNYNDIFVTTLKLPDAYVRPKGGTPVLAALVPAYRPCASGNRTHGGGITSPSCNPPIAFSSYLTLGTPDAGGGAANGSGFARFDVCPVSGCAAPEVRVSASISDVRCKTGVATCGTANTAGGSDYTGTLSLDTTIRITDRNNTSGSNPPGSGTMVDYTLSVPFGCTQTPDGSRGADCSVQTTVNSVVPGAITGGMRAIWELQRSTVRDGGADGDVSTTSDNTRFLTQGVFVP